MIATWWPLAVLAAIQLTDAALCWKPVEFIRDCLVDVRFPRRFWRVLPALKAASAAGLIIGIWFPPLALLTCAALVCYFVVAITMHVTARDFGRNLFVNASGMLALCAAALVFVIVSA
ncbi:MAG: DoxX family protein [Mycobacterium sp.]